MRIKKASFLFLSLLFVVLLGVDLYAASPDPNSPPVSGDQLITLLAMHRHYPVVTAMLEWTGHSLRDDTRATISGKGLALTFVQDRVTKIALTVGSSETPHWEAALPKGFKRDLHVSELPSGPGWTEQIKGRRYRTQAHATIGTHALEGIDVVLDFDPDGLLQTLTIQVDLKTYWQRYCSIVEESLRGRQFNANQWPALVGSDVSTQDGNLLAAWVGLPLGDNEATRAGVTLTLKDEFWIERITFNPFFDSQRPLGVGKKPTAEAIDQILGPSRHEGSNIDHWTVSLPDSPPLHVELNVPEYNAELNTTLTLSRPHVEVEKWFALMQAMEAPDPALIASIGRVWQLAQSSPETLLGRKEVTQGLLGSVVRWHTEVLLSEVIGGLITAPADDDLFPARTIEYVLRRLRSGHPDGHRQLEYFQDPLSKLLGTGWKESLHEAKDTSPTSLRWERRNADPFSPGTTLSLEAREAEQGSGLDLVLVISVPIPNAIPLKG